MDIKLVLENFQNGNKLKTEVYDAESKDLILERIDIFTGTKEVILKIPVSPKKLLIQTYSLQNGKLPLGADRSFAVPKPEIMSLKEFKVDMGSGDKEFINFAQKFASELPSLTPDGKVRKSPSGKFKIVLFDILKAHDGRVIPTPCMIGVKTGTIEVSKSHFQKMSQSQRVATLSHEYGHFYKNPLIDKAIEDEVGADLNGMAVFVGAGYGLSEYVNAFKKVFRGAQSDLNRRRYRVMNSFAHKINNGEYFIKPYNL